MVKASGGLTDKNLYAYCDSEPVNRQDPSGYFWESLFDIISFGSSVNSFIKEPSLRNFGVLLYDGGALLTPAPSTGTVKVISKVGKKATKGAAKANEELVDLYRAVSPGEFEDIFKVNGFRGKPNGFSYEAKQFGRDFNEILDLANQPIMRDTAAIVKVKVPKNVFEQLNHMPLDVRFLKSGSATVEPEMLDIFNKSIKSIEHVY